MSAELQPHESMALTVARTQANRGDPITPNVALVVVGALDRVAGNLPPGACVVTGGERDQSICVDACNPPRCGRLVPDPGIQTVAAHIVDSLVITGAIGNTESVVLGVAIGTLPMSAYDAEMAAVASYIGGEGV